MAAGTASAYEVGEPVLCLHAAGLFDAKVLEVRASPAGHIYLVHYLGWRKTWDEHVPESRLRKRTAENLAEKERLASMIVGARRMDGAKRKAVLNDDGSEVARPVPSLSAAKKKLAADKQYSTSPAPAGAEAVADAAGVMLPADGGGGTDAPGADGTIAAGAPGCAPDVPSGAESCEIRLTIPQPLKIRMVTDWEAVTREHKLVPLPRSPSVSQILDEFCQAKARRTSHERLYTEIRAGVAAYFNQARAQRLSPLLSDSPVSALGQALLYRYERKQFDELGALPGCEGRPVDEVYGAEHLLRLLVKLPAFLEATAMDADQRLVLQAKLQELLKFLQKNQALYFGAKHVSPPKEYLEWWEAHETAGGADAPGGKGAAAQAAADGSGKAPAGAAPRNANGARSQ